MRLAFELSGESESIPRAEVLAIFHGLVVQEIERVVVMDVEIFDQQLANRLAMTHAVIEVKDICAQKLTSIYQAAQNIELPRVSVAVRAKRIGPGLKSVDVEATIGKALAERGFEIDLAHPQLLVRALLSDDVCIIGKTLTQINRFRPYFYPGVLLPRIARAAVNLSGIKAHELIFDPFCGTGGLLLEAGLIGATALGSDVDSRMVFGTKMNLDYFGVESALLVQDAMRLALQDECVDAVTTDLPYGRSVSIHAQSLGQLTEMALDEILRILKSGARAVLISHNPIEREVLDVGFTIEGRHTQYVHKSLTREIVVVRK
jgi:tRNA (guanine10-N2)-dimethyltransferase